MNVKKKREILYKYIKCSSLPYYFFFGGIVMMIIFYFTDYTILVMGLLGIVFGGIHSLNCISLHKGLKRMLDQVDIDILYEDYENGIIIPDYPKDIVTIGKTYLIGRKASGFYNLDDIRNVYLFIQKKNFSENGKELRGILKNGKTVTLCVLPLKKEGYELAQKIVDALISVRPNIIIGYQN